MPDLTIIEDGEQTGHVRISEQGVEWEYGGENRLVEKTLSDVEDGMSAVKPITEPDSDADEVSLSPEQTVEHLRNMLELIGVKTSRNG